jgi:hypothetical protein
MENELEKHVRRLLALYAIGQLNVGVASRIIRLMYVETLRFAAQIGMEQLPQLDSDSMRHDVLLLESLERDLPPPLSTETGLVVASGPFPEEKEEEEYRPGIYL